MSVQRPGFEKISRNLYPKNYERTKLDHDEIESQRCTCDCVGKPGGFALARSDTDPGCDPNPQSNRQCTAAYCYVECPK